MNRLPPHNPNVGWLHHGPNLRFRMDHPTHLFRHRHSPVIPMFAHAPPKDPPDTTLRALLPHQTMLPLFLFVRDERGGDDDWVMVEPAAGGPKGTND